MSIFDARARKNVVVASIKEETIYFLSAVLQEQQLSKIQQTSSVKH